MFKNKYYLCILIFLLFDILTKQLALIYLNEFESKSFIPFIDLYLTYNSGIAFGFLDFGHRALSNLLTIVGICIVIYIFMLLNNENESFKKLALSNIPMGKLATESDVATSVCFLASSASSMVTATSILVDGGWTAK